MLYLVFDFISLLTNWYVRLNRARIKGNDGLEESKVSLSTLFHVLFVLCKLMASFTPFFAEYVYQHIKKYAPKEENVDSVHYLSVPEPWKEAISEQIEEAVSSMRTVIELGRTARDRRKMPMKYPLLSMTVIETNQKLLDNLKSLENYILLELNISELILSTDEGKYVKLSLDPDRAKLGKRLRADASAVYKAIAALSMDDIKKFIANGKMEINGKEICTDDVKINRSFVGDTKKFEACWEGGIVAVLDLEENKELRQKGLAREFINRVQKARKRSGITPNDTVDVYYRCTPENGELAQAIKAQNEYIFKAINDLPKLYTEKSKLIPDYIVEESPIKGADETLLIALTAPKVFICESEVEKLYGKEMVESINIYLSVKDREQIVNELKDNKLTFILIEKEITLELGNTLFTEKKF